MMDAYGAGGPFIMYFNHIPGGSNVLFMDGHVEFVRYTGSPLGVDIDVRATAPVLPGMAPIIGVGDGTCLRVLMQEKSESQ